MLNEIINQIPTGLLIGLFVFSGISFTFGVILYSNQHMTGLLLIMFSAIAADISISATISEDNRWAVIILPVILIVGGMMIAGNKKSDKSQHKNNG